VSSIKISDPVSGFPDCGLSVVTLIFDDQADNRVSRQQVLEKLSQLNLWPNLNPQLGPDYSPVGQLYFYTLKSTNPKYDLMELKALEDWYLEKQFKSVPNVVELELLSAYSRQHGRGGQRCEGRAGCQDLRN
jgi:cobalt-zinc-cadmium resistance protein CzcA